jgi:signal transduction histidine kinase
MTAAVYVAERRDMLELATERLNRSGLQFAVGLGQQSGQGLAQLDRLSRRPVVRQFATGDAALADAVGDTLRGRVETAGAEVIELWSPAGRLLQTSDGSTAAPRILPEGGAATGQTWPRPPAGVSPMEREGDRLSYTIATPVRVGGADRALLVQRHVLQNSPQQADAVTELIGSRARVVVGSPGTGAWTDLAGPVEAPPVRTAGEDIIEYDRSSGRRVLARALEVPGTPWLLVMELDRAAVLEPARQFLRRTLFLSIVLSIGGAGAAWLMSRKISGPLRDVTRAAEALSVGRAVPPLLVRREDEVGRLGRAFNVMTNKVVEARHELEQRVAERTAALEAANRELEAFSYSVSHDLRAPLRAVDGFAAVLVEDHEGELSDEARRCVRLIRGSAQQMGQLIDDLLAFSRLGRQQLHRTRVDMNALVGAVVADTCTSVRRDPGEFTVEPLPPAFAEPSMLRQVVANYVENALKFTRDVRPPAIRITGRVENGEIVYSVHDNGVGFDMRYVDKLFGVFQRLHAAEEYQGTGVGLAIVKRVIERHGGRVWAEGEPGRGATFHFTLPNAHGSDDVDSDTSTS